MCEKPANTLGNNVANIPDDGSARKGLFPNAVFMSGAIGLERGDLIST